MRGAIFALLVAVLLSGCRSSHEQESPLCSIAALKSECSGETRLIRRDVIIRGTVAANDYLNEFAHRIIVADATNAIEIAIDDNDTAALFPIHTLVEIYCNGLAMGRLGYNIILGARPTGSFPIDELSVAMATKHICAIGIGQEAEYTPRSIEQLTTSDIGQLILIQDISIVGASAAMWW